MSCDYSQLHELYEMLRKLPGRNYAKEHSFEEWVEYRHIVAEKQCL